MSKFDEVMARVRKRDEERSGKLRRVAIVMSKTPAKTPQGTFTDLRSRTTAADLSSGTPIVGTSTTERKP